MTPTLLNPEDDAERNVAKLLKISEALMRRVEQTTDESGAGYAHFQRAVMLEEEIRQRTRDLEKTLELLNDSNARLAAANEAEQRARANLGNALEAVEEGFALFGPDGRMVMFNSRFCRGLPDVRGRLSVGMRFDEYIDLVSRTAALDPTQEGLALTWADRLRRLHESEHEIFNVPLKRGVWLQVSEHLTSDGGVAILQTDITDMIRQERAERTKLLDDQARMSRATLDHINQGVCIFDGEGRLADWNRRLGALLTPPIKLVRRGAPFDALCDHIVRGAVFTDGMSAEGIRAWVAESAPRAPVKFDMERADGVILSVFATEMPDHGFVISFTDVTSERRAVEALSTANESLEMRVRERTLDLEQAVSVAESANATKSRFVAAASHDLLQPLSAAKLFISSLESMDLDTRTNEIVRRAENALGSVESILGALLDISRLDSGNADLKREPIALRPMLERLHEEFAPAARAKGLALRLAPTCAVVESDQSYLRRILQNLISNAIRYTGTGGVLIGVRRAGNDEARIGIWDTGPGVPEDRRADIFKEFHRLDAHGNATEGMGLGLTIVERACAQLGHRLQLRSTVGRGSCFSVTARRATAAATARAAVAKRGANAIGDDLLVLIVEDDEEVAAALAMQLEAWGISAFEARSGALALRLLEETGVSPDIVLADYALENGETGPEAIAAIRAQHGPIPAGIVTASQAPAVRSECFRLGLRMIPKPISETRLFSFIAEAS
ncbi:response regulator [Pikeienuella piscinae]|uniref:histidine kinase n=1 Tax=Pikeienuella piscinae TaxID=2748098 RepID=A0A7L5BUA9_9RHOB|nr:PAS-domain containing protein [Pikeienuella piscinae]QIE55830.1 response regulator [Pikeienuella piscinae]